MSDRPAGRPGQLARRVVVVAASLVVVVAGGFGVGRFVVDDVEITRDLLQTTDRQTQARLERQRDCLSESLDRLIPDGAKVRVRVPPPAAHRIIEALLPRHSIVEGDPQTQGAWLVESSRLSKNTGCLRGLQVLAP
jgi:hypothetical protein